MVQIAQIQNKRIKTERNMSNSFLLEVSPQSRNVCQITN